MIKKLLGMLFAAAVLGTIVLTILGRGNYRSMIWDDEPGVSHLIRSVVPKVSKLHTDDDPATPATPDAGATTAETATEPDATASGTTTPISTAPISQDASHESSRPVRSTVASQRGQNASSSDDRPLRRARKNADGEYEDYLDMPDSIECPDPLAELNK